MRPERDGQRQLVNYARPAGRLVSPSESRARLAAGRPMERRTRVFVRLATSGDKSAPESDKRAAGGGRRADETRRQLERNIELQQLAAAETRPALGRGAPIVCVRAPKRTIGRQSMRLEAGWLAGWHSASRLHNECLLKVDKTLAGLESGQLSPTGSKSRSLSAATRGDRKRCARSFDGPNCCKQLGSKRDI